MYYDSTSLYFFSFFVTLPVHYTRWSKVCTSRRRVEKNFSIVNGSKICEEIVNSCKNEYLTSKRANSPPENDNIEERISHALLIASLFLLDYQNYTTYYRSKRVYSLIIHFRIRGAEYVQKNRIKNDYYTKGDGKKKTIFANLTLFNG